MSDWSNAAVPERINPWTLAAQPYQSLIGQPFTTSSGSWATANQAIYLPFVLPWRYPVRRVFWCNGGIVNGNVDVGIYTINGGRIWSLGGVAQAGGGQAMQYTTPASPFILPSGRYYFAMAMTSTSGQLVGCNADSKVRAVGFYQQASAYPLPAQATFAPWTSNFIVPIAGLMASASGI